MHASDLVWLGLMVLFLLVEAGTVTLVSLWFAGGSLAAMVISLLGGPVWLQAAVFVLVSGALLALLRPLVRKYLSPKITSTNIDALIGSQGLVTQAIDNLTAAGQVKLGGMVWTARSTSGDPIAQGQKVKVDHIEGVKVFVTPVKESVPC